LDEAAFDHFCRKLPAVSAIYFAQESINDIDKSLHGLASLTGFFVMTIGWWKEAIDMVKDPVT
jgi:hypothetical protein